MLSPSAPVTVKVNWMASAESAASAVETVSSETASDTTSEETASEEAAEDADAPQPASSAADRARVRISAESFFMWKFPLYEIKIPRSGIAAR